MLGPLYRDFELAVTGRAFAFLQEEAAAAPGSSVMMGKSGAAATAGAVTNLSPLEKESFMRVRVCAPVCVCLCGCCK